MSPPQPKPRSVRRDGSTNSSGSASGPDVPPPPPPVTGPAVPPPPPPQQLGEFAGGSPAKKKEPIYDLGLNRGRDARKESVYDFAAPVRPQLSEAAKSAGSESDEENDDVDDDDDVDELGTNGGFYDMATLPHDPHSENAYSLAKVGHVL